MDTKTRYASRDKKHGYAVDRNALEAGLCLERFDFFVKKFWHTIIQEPLVWNWHMSVLCHELQVVVERAIARQPKLYDLVVNVPPGTSKSTIASEMLHAWGIAKDPTLRNIAISHTDSLSLDIATKCRDIIKSEKYQKLFPHVEIREDVGAKSMFQTTRGGWRFAGTVGGKTPMGRHAHVITVDDPIDPKQVGSEIAVVEANNYMSRVLPSRMVDKRITPIILIMQRLHQNDPTAYWLKKKKKVRHICLPAEVSDKVRPAHLAKFYKKGLLDPVRLPAYVLRDALEEMGEYAYSGQYRQHPVPLGGGMFKTERFKFGLPPRKMKRIVRYWDKAATPGGGAYSVGLKMGQDFDGRFWILDIVRGQWDTYEREERIKQTAQADGRNVIVWVEQEPGSGGKHSAQDTVRRLAGFRVRVRRESKNKVLRADPFSVQVNAGNVYILEGMTGSDALISEAEFFPNSTYKDIIDGCSGAFYALRQPVYTVGVIA